MLEADFTCVECGRHFEQSASLQGHIIKMHSRRRGKAEEREEPPPPKGGICPVCSTDIWRIVYRAGGELIMCPTCLSMLYRTSFEVYQRGSRAPGEPGRPKVQRDALARLAEADIVTLKEKYGLGWGGRVECPWARQ